MCKINDVDGGVEINKESSGFGRKIACQFCIVTNAWLVYDLI